MTKLELLTTSIENRQPISFQYNRPGKTEGVRIGNAHAIYIFTSDAGAISTKLHLVQTKGVSDTANKEAKSYWRTFNMEYISDINILNESKQFEISDGYNPESYDNPIAKI